MIFYLAFFGIIHLAIAGALINVAINNASANAKRIQKHLLIQEYSRLHDLTIRASVYDKAASAHHHQLAQDTWNKAFLL